MSNLDYNLIHHYNKVVPNAYSKESLRNEVLGKDMPDNKYNGWDKSTYTIYIDKATKENITLIGGKMYEKFLNNPYNLWRSIRLKQNLGEKDILNPELELDLLCRKK